MNGVGFTRDQMVDAAKKQIEYYLSEENLTRDTFLRSKMDADGWVPLHVIMNFNRSLFFLTQMCNPIVIQTETVDR